MSRIWYLASTTAPPSASNIISPTKAICDFEGERAPNPTTGYGYPRGYTDDQWCEILYRQRKIQFDNDYQLTGNLSGDAYIYTSSMSGVLDTGKTDERQLIQQGEAQGGWIGIIDCHQTVTINGVLNQDSVTPRTVRLRWGFAQDNLGNPVDPYVYGTASLTWVPAFFLQIANGFFNTNGASIGDPSNPPGTHILTTSGIFRADPFTYKIACDSFLNIANFNLSLSPSEWWAYRDSQGNNPIWDTTNGAQLRNPVTQQF